MGIGRRIGKRWKAALLVAVGAAGGGAALAAASVPGSGGVINACYEATDASGLPVSGPNVHIINTSGGQTCSTFNDATTYVPLDWNQTGPTGATGSAGTPGAAGSPGAAGKTVTVVSGSTLTLPNGDVLTVGPSALTAPPPTNGQPIGVLKVNGLKQGSAVNNHSASIEVFGFAFGASSQGSSGGASGKRQHSPITIVKEVDSASPSLFQALVTNEAFKTVQLSFSRPSKSGQEMVYQRITLTNALISSVERYGGTVGKGHKTLESLSFTFQKIEVTT